MPFELDAFLVIALLFQALAFSRLGFWAFTFSSLLSLIFGLQLSTGIFSGFGVEALFAFDAYRQIFFVIVSGLGLVIGFYSRFYMSESPDTNRLFGLLGIFQWACLATILSNHLIFLVIAWELTSITSFLLIGFDRKDEQAQKGALQAFLVTSLGGFCLFAAAVLIGQNTGSYLINDFLISTEVIGNLPQKNIILLLVIVAILTKSAQFPFHFWLPGAMKAPTPVSAYLHSATLVKLGVFLCGLFWPVFSHFTLWHVILSGAGLLSFAWGALMSVFQRDLKSGLAHTTFSQLGLAIMLLSQKSELAFSAGVVVVIAHALYKSSLFLSVGVISKMTGTQTLKNLSGLIEQSKIFWGLVLISGLSMAGFPPFFGFIGKELALEVLSGPFATRFAQVFSWSCFSIGAIATAFFAFSMSFKIFFERAPLLKISAPKSSLLACLAPMAFLSLVFSFFPQLISNLLAQKVSVVPQTLGIPLTHGLNWNLALSAVYLLAAATFFFFLFRSEKFWNFEAEKRLSWLRISTYFQKLLFDFLSKLCRFVLEKVQKLSDHYAVGSLVLSYLLISFLFLPKTTNLSFHIHSFNHGILVVVCFIAALLSILAFRFQNVAVSIFIISGVGYLIAYSFAVFGAPDLVLTQLLVETATLLLMLLAWLSHQEPAPKQKKPVSLWLLSGATSFVLLFSFAVLFDPELTKLSSLYFFETSKPLAHGANLVNVILVDFRGLDTLGEISVLAIAFVACKAMSARLPELTKKPFAYPALTPWMKSLSQLFIPLLFGFGVFYLLRGHDLPGGGFVGGLLFALALFLRTMIFAKKSPSVLLVAGGLLFAYGSAAFSVFTGREFFESFVTPLGPSALFFDIGVFFVVAGAISGILEVLIRFRVRHWRKIRVGDV